MTWLDLAQVAPAKGPDEPPVCRLVDVKKEEYARAKKKRLNAATSGGGEALKEFQFKANIAEHDFSRKVQSVADALAGGHPTKVRVTYTRSIRKVQGLNPGDNWDARPLLRKVQEAVEGLAPGAKLQSQSVAGVRAEMTFLLPRKK